MNRTQDKTDMDSRLIANEIAAYDGLFHLHKGDVLILSAEVRLSREALDEIHQMIEKYGVESIILGNQLNPVGVIENDKTD